MSDPVTDATQTDSQKLRSLAHRAVTEGVNLKYVEQMRQAMYAAADALEVLHNAANEQPWRVAAVEYQERALAAEARAEQAERGRDEAQARLPEAVEMMAAELGWDGATFDAQRKIESERARVETLTQRIEALRLRVIAEPPYTDERDTYRDGFKSGLGEALQIVNSPALAAATPNTLPDCTHENHSFDRSICFCGSMHYYCVDCGAQVDECSVAAPTTSGEDG